MTAIGKRYIMSVDKTEDLPEVEPAGTQCWDEEAQTMKIFIGGVWTILAENTPTATSQTYVYADAAARTADVANRSAGDLGYATTEETINVHDGISWIAVAP
jgi:hypothetical protein